MLLWGSSRDQSAGSSQFPVHQASRTVAPGVFGVRGVSRGRVVHRGLWGGVLAVVLLSSACSGGTGEGDPASQASSSQPPVSSPSDVASTDASPTQSVDEGAGGDVAVEVPAQVVVEAVRSVSAPALADTVAVARLSPGTVLAAERDGTLWLVDDTGEQQVDSDALLGLRERIAADEERTDAGVAGVMGIAVEGSVEGATVFFSVSTGATTSVLAMPWDGQTIQQGRTIVEGLPAGNGVNGGALGLGPEGYLYVSVGDAGQPDLAQNLESLAGKILRYRTDGGIPQSNPLTDSPVWSSGHHEVVSFAWANGGHMFAVERGGQFADELNSIRGGGNYGWPLMEGDRDVDRAMLLAGDTQANPNGTPGSDDAGVDGDQENTDTPDSASADQGGDADASGQDAQERSDTTTPPRPTLTGPVVQWQREATPLDPDMGEPLPFGDVVSIAAGDFAVVVTQGGDGHAWWIPIPQSTATEQLSAQEILTDTQGPLGWVDTTADMTELTVHAEQGLTTYSVTPQSWTQDTSSSS